jgi:large subunit ribosomal protein L23
MKDPHTIILNQLISEKGTDLAANNNQYLFNVAREANKIEVQKAVEAIFNVKVLSVQIVNRVGKPKRRGLVMGRTARTKRAIVRLKQGDTIALT